MKSILLFSWHYSQANFFTINRNWKWLTFFFLSNYKLFAWWHVRWNMSSKSFIKSSLLMDCSPYILILTLEQRHTQKLHLVPWVIGKLIFSVLEYHILKEEGRGGHRCSMSYFIAICGWFLNYTIDRGLADSDKIWLLNHGYTKANDYS